MRTFYKLTNAEKVLANNKYNKIDNEISFIGTIWYKSSIESYTYCCGCSYIGNKMVLTAAHCLQGRIDLEIKVMFGSTTLSQKHIECTIEKIKIHPDFQIKKHKNDIAVIFLKEEPPISSINLPNNDIINKLYRINEDVFVYGFGKTVKNKGVSINLRKIILNIILLKNTKYTRHIVDQNMLCAKDVRKVPLSQKMDTCKGDSGNALIKKFNNKYYIIGIVNFGVKKANINYPGVYARTSSFLDWIRNL